MYTHTNTNICIHTHIHTDMYTYTHMYINIHIYIYTHAHYIPDSFLWLHSRSKLLPYLLVILCWKNFSNSFSSKFRGDNSQNVITLIKTTKMKIRVQVYQCTIIIPHFRLITQVIWLHIYCFYYFNMDVSIYPTPPHKQDVTQGQFLSRD